MDLEVRHLRCLAAVEEAGSVTGAARRLGLSQPALTAQLRRIEETVGGEVFARARHGVRLTALGEVLLPHVRDVLGALEDVERAVHAHRAPPDRTVLRMGVRSTPLASRLCDVAARAFPGRIADLSVVDRQAVAMEVLARGELDLVLHVDFPGREAAPPPGVRVLPVGSEPVFVALPPGHPTTRRSALDLADLEGLGWLLVVNGDDEFDHHLLEQCRLAGLGSVVIRATDPLLVAQLIRRGDPVVMAVQALDTGVAPPGPVRELRGAPVRVRHLLLWAEGGPVDDALAERVRAGLVDAYRALVGTHGHIPGWWERNPGWLGSAPACDTGSGKVPLRAVR
ncbi:LysR family transcriptional regulator [Streptomyces chumphonensis]|uniref:LysR family transcriptional regulator n=1 Tax=Streptomyces chumphonensis TaxID=1214925 RepID=A0A927EVR7_9ACTN|nr:LysR family transcriptional regulator [Streptomyces chumphonensis]MBD3930416.1 LysR family transcriptional regulator [Streptomyces chumphonensis]